MRNSDYSDRLIIMEEKDLKKIQETIEEFLQKMTITGFDLELKLVLQESKPENFEGLNSIDASAPTLNAEPKESVNVNMQLNEPQFLIGQNGQTLLEFQRLLKILLNKKLNKIFYLDLDINDYKKKKLDYLRNLAKNSADEVSQTKEKKILPPMSAYERRVIHIELKQRQDVAVESHGEGIDRCIVITPV